MNPIENPELQIAGRPDPPPLSLLNDFLFCPRRAGLKVVEGLLRANVHTLIGDLAHATQSKFQRATTAGWQATAN